MSGDGPEGLRSRGPDRPGRDEALEFPRSRAEAMAIHRDRRIKVATAMLAASLVLGVYWTADFYYFSVTPGEPVGDFGGLVVDTNDAPVVGANVTVEGTALTAVSDANGSFVLHNVTSGRITLIVARSGYVTSIVTVFAVPSKAGDPLVHSELIRLDAGSGTTTRDVATERDGWLAACMSTFLIGNVLNLLGLVATFGRRRYRHAMLGCVGAILSFGAIIGLLFGVIAMFLLMGARDEFEDRKSLFATEHDMPFPRGDAELDEGGAPEAGGEAEGGDPVEPRVVGEEEPPSGPLEPSKEEPAPAEGANGGGKGP